MSAAVIDIRAALATRWLIGVGAPPDIAEGFLRNYCGKPQPRSGRRAARVRRALRSRLRLQSDEARHLAEMFEVISCDPHYMAIMAPIIARQVLRYRYGLVAVPEAWTDRVQVLLAELYPSREARVQLQWRLERAQQSADHG